MDAVLDAIATETAWPPVANDDAVCVIKPNRDPDDLMDQLTRIMLTVEDKSEVRGKQAEARQLGVGGGNLRGRVRPRRRIVQLPSPHGNTHSILRVLKINEVPRRLALTTSAASGRDYYTK